MRKPKVFVSLPGSKCEADVIKAAEIGDLQLIVNFNEPYVVLLWLGPDGWKYLEDLVNTTGYVPKEIK